MTPPNLTHSDVCLIKIYNKKLKTIRVPCKNTNRFQQPVKKIKDKNRILNSSQIHCEFTFIHIFILAWLWLCISSQQNLIPRNENHEIRIRFDIGVAGVNNHFSLTFLSPSDIIVSSEMGRWIVSTVEKSQDPHSQSNVQTTFHQPFIVLIVS